MSPPPNSRWWLLLNVVLLALVLLCADWHYRHFPIFKTINLRNFDSLFFWLASVICLLLANIYHAKLREALSRATQTLCTWRAVARMFVVFLISYLLVNLPPSYFLDYDWQEGSKIKSATVMVEGDDKKYPHRGRNSRMTFRVSRSPLLGDSVRVMVKKGGPDEWFTGTFPPDSHSIRHPLLLGHKEVNLNKYVMEKPIYVSIITEEKTSSNEQSELLVTQALPNQCKDEGLAKRLATTVDNCATMLGDIFADVSIASDGHIEQKMDEGSLVLFNQTAKQPYVYCYVDGEMTVDLAIFAGSSRALLRRLREDCRVGTTIQKADE